ncbi:MAG: glucose-6-phosphate 1-dehydrogenase, partial [Kiritimatiellia bacterium]
MTVQLSQVVIFGASGDLTARKLIPALLGNQMVGDLDDHHIQIIGVARRDKTDEGWRAELAEWLDEAQTDAWVEFSERVYYHRADSLIAEDVLALGATLDALARRAGREPDDVGRLFYLALKPSLFGGTVANLSAAGLLACDPDEVRAYRRVIAEKPFGTDLVSAKQLNRELLCFLREDQILRIDHYLGKETVQNILAFRFQNAIFEPLWNRHHIESVEISVCETVGMEGGRGGYYDTAGALRDMVQNHVLQILALIAMEPPSSMDADAVRNEKVQVLDSLGYPTPEQVVNDVVRGQYLASDARERGYLDEQGVDPASVTESYVAIRAGVHNWRWNGVPFFLRTGKCLAERYTEVVLHFRKPPVDLLSGTDHGDMAALRPNALRLLIQPV